MSGGCFIIMRQNNLYHLGATWARSIAMLLLMWHSLPVCAGAFEFADDTHGPDVISHPIGYTGSGEDLIVTVGISPSSPNALAMEVSIQNAIDTWNHLIPTTGNIKTNNGSIQRTQFDFESVALHELGHCIGLSHPNLASESGLLGEDKNFTRTTKGANNTFDLDSGVDGIIGSNDDIRGDDVNLHWFHKLDNNPFTLGDVVDSTTYSRDLSDLPAGDLFVVNADRDVSALFGVQNTEAVMQQGITSGETRRSLTADDVATVRLGMSGVDRLADTSDDYTLTLQYAGFTDTADIVFNFDNKASFASCTFSGTFLNSNRDHFIIDIASISFNESFSWFFNDELKSLMSELPVTTILVNDASDTLTLAPGERLSLDVVLDPGLSIGNQADYWVRADTPLGTFWLNDALQFIESEEPLRAFGGALMELPSFNILNGSTNGLPSGVYTIVFAVDDNKDGVFDATFQDTITFIINP
ncbi:MAG: M10 family metallopeptidase domain-containing protein [Nitrosomonas sp.]|nr:M10 family metallopeptidase domain-containing protein [Nitrosomonas sp.]